MQPIHIFVKCNRCICDSQLSMATRLPWLAAWVQVLARMHAQRLGMRAIRRAAIERQLDEDLARERRALLSMLEAGQ